MQNKQNGIPKSNHINKYCNENDQNTQVKRQIFRAD